MNKKSKRIFKKGDVRKIINNLLRSFPNDIAIGIEVQRGMDEVMNPLTIYRTFKPGKGITIIIEFGGGARDGYCGPDEEGRWGR